MKLKSYLSVLALLVAFVSTSWANLDYTVTLNTTSLVGNGNSPFSLDLALSSGSQFPNSFNTVTLSNFVFTNGSVGATSYSIGGESGSMSSSVTLITSSEDNELAQFFSSGVTHISFKVDETSNTDNPFQDQFYVAILDNGLNNIPTTDPSGGNTLVLSNINTAQTINSVATYQSTAGGEAPGVTASVAAVPEPTSITSLMLGLGVMGLCICRKMRSSLGLSS
jgi:hypothetical protein